MTDNGEDKTELRKLRNRIKNPEFPFPPDAQKLIEFIDGRGYEPDLLNPKIFDVLHCSILRARENMIDEDAAEYYLKLMESATNASERNYFTKKQVATLEKWKSFISERCNRVISHKPVVNDDELKEEEDLHDENGPRRLRMAETVLSRRTNRIALVMERCFNSLNQQAILRTAECLGIQYIYVVSTAKSKRKNVAKKLTKGNDSWLTIKKFKTSKECIDALKKEGREIWATDLSQDSCSLEGGDIVIPEKVAIVVGNETEGVTKEMLEAAEKRIYLPMHGFSESLNLGVASALVLQKLLSLCPDARGNLSQEEKATLRKEWYLKLSNNDKQEALFKKFLDSPPEPFDDLRRCEHFRDNKSWVHKRLHKRLREIDEHEEEKEPKKFCSESITKNTE